MIANVAAYHGFEPAEVRLEDFTGRWLPGLQSDGRLVGLNWSGTRATGYDVTPADAARTFEAQSIELSEAWVPRWPSPVGLSRQEDRTRCAVRDRLAVVATCMQSMR